MRRVPEVLDCWFESGSMPFAQVHYPFENREWFESHYPGDFIVEYIGQTRGWFYTLHVLATALFDRPAFRTCVSHGIVLGDDGQKMSKSLQQLPRPDDGVRHVRRRRDALVPAQLADPARRRLRRSPRTASARRFARCCCRSGTPGTSSSLYANAAGTQGTLPTEVDGVEHRRARPLHPGQDRTTSSTTSTASMDDYDLFAACASGPHVPRRADQLVRPAQPRPVLGRRPGRDRHAAHRARACSAASRRRCCR